jgi:Uma2 family endonuclease
MALHDRSARLTYDDYRLIPEDGWCHEILDGEHHVTAAPYLRHQEVLIQLAEILQSFIRRNRLGKLFVAPTDVLLSRHDIVQPDLVFVSQDRLGILTRRNIQGAPDLVIEILSDSTRRVDQGAKLDLYERSGVREYWLLDPDAQTVAVQRLEGERFRSAALVSADGEDVLVTPLLPGLELRMGEIFA